MGDHFNIVSLSLECGYGKKMLCMYFFTCMHPLFSTSTNARFVVVLFCFVFVCFCFFVVFFLFFCCCCFLLCVVLFAMSGLAQEAF